MRIKSLSHIGITVRSLEDSARWYWEVFRLPLVAEGQMDKTDLSRLKALYHLDDCSIRFGFLLCPKGGVVEIFEFSKMNEMQHSWNRPGATHFTFDVNGIDGWYKKLSGRSDVEVLTSVQKTEGNEWFFFRDPDGNFIELIDLKFNYVLLRYLNKIAGIIMRKFRFGLIYKKPVS